MRARQSTAQDCKARLVVTMPPSPSRLDKALAASPGAGMLTLTDTVVAFQHLARRATQRLIVMMPFIDYVGCEWVLDMFSVTPASQRILILKHPRQVDDLKHHGDRLRATATQLHYYSGEGEIDETFHSKVVLADSVAAYVGSANLLNRSKSLNLECGLLVEGAVVTSISTFVDAVLETFRPELDDRHRFIEP